ncbi:MAG: DUF4270 family protein [Bacteroidales bacterium]|nr:DUF4270 family protein [Bacteroidales bacterium]
MKKKDLWVYVIIMVMVGFISSCQLSDQKLGKDLLPPGDNVFLYHDTIFEIHAYPVSGKPFISSENSLNADDSRVFLLGNIQDTIVGSSVATLITDFSTNSAFKNGPNMEIDSLLLFLHMKDYVGDMSEEITIRIHELTERIYMDSAYYSDFNAEGLFNPVPLAEKSILPEDATTVEFLIEDEDYLNKFLSIESDTSFFRNDSIFKDLFNGFYITAESQSSEGVMARVHLSNQLSRVSMKYANDSTEVDTTAGRDYIWTHFSINEYYCQKINIFEHDFSGTYLSGIIDNENVSTPYSYVQGMAGVNTRLSFTSLEEWINEGPIAINSATLIFGVVPESESGILYDDLPNRLMIHTFLESGEYEPLYDPAVLYANLQHYNQFGGFLKGESDGMFFDTTYTYRFNMPLHFQAMVSGEKPDYDFILRLNDLKKNPKISKLWSNLPANRKRIRLEVVYLKL